MGKVGEYHDDTQGYINNRRTVKFASDQTEMFLAHLNLPQVNESESVTRFDLTRRNKMFDNSRNFCETNPISESPLRCLPFS